jgi:hypothetical protein
MDVYNLRRQRRELGEIGRMYLLVVGLFLLGLLVWEVGRYQGPPPWELGESSSAPPLPHYGR